MLTDNNPVVISEQPQVEYRPVALNPARYRVGDDGSFWSWTPGNKNRMKLYPPRWRRLKTSVGARGYMKATLVVDGKERTVHVHTLVLTAFVGPRPDGREACHFDGNPANNAISNLRWGTPSENQHDAIRHGRKPLGDRHHKAVLTAGLVIEIRNIYAAGGITIRALAKRYGFSHITLRDMIRRRYWKHV